MAAQSAQTAVQAAPAALPENGVDFVADEQCARLRLIRSRRVGPVTFHRLLAEHGSAVAALEALPAVAAAAGVSDYRICSEAEAAAELEAGASIGARPLFHGESGYPADLAQIADAPPVLWLQGDARLLQRPLLALVGARNASSLGGRMARRLAAALGEAGFVIVSGLARGIDAEAHLGALPSGTIAVLPGGVNRDVPEENAALAAQIRQAGLCLSEHPPGLAPQARHFPARNRIISGLCRAVVVVEAAARSGSLITARAALDQGREVLAVPGHPFDARASGCNLLLRDGATLIRGAADVIEALGAPLAGWRAAESRLPMPPAPMLAAAPAPAPAPAAASAGRGGAEMPPAAPEQRSLAQTAALHAQILDRLNGSPTAEDQLSRDLALPPSLLMAELLSLELEGRVQRRPGGLLSRL